MGQTLALAVLVATFTVLAAGIVHQYRADIDRSREFDRIAARQRADRALARTDRKSWPC